MKKMHRKGIVALLLTAVIVAYLIYGLRAMKAAATHKQDAAEMRVRFLEFAHKTFIQEIEFLRHGAVRFGAVDDRKPFFWKERIDYSIDVSKNVRGDEVYYAANGVMYMTCTQEAASQNMLMIRDLRDSMMMALGESEGFRGSTDLQFIVRKKEGREEQPQQVIVDTNWKWKY